MFTAVAGGILMVLICTLSIFLYIPVLYVFYRRPEFNSLVAYQLMFWTGIMDVGQLIVFDVSGVVATFQWNRFPSYVNKVRSHYNTLFDKNHVKIIYLLAFLIFLLPWLTKLTPYSSYCFSEWNLEWHYMPEDNRVLTRLSHYFGTYGILVFLVPSAITYTIIFIYIFSQKERSMKRTEVIFTIQQLLVSLLYLFGFIYWSTIDVWSTGTLIMNFFSNLTWIIMIALNPFIYLIVNR
nr:7TM GPCR chemoreceptor domain containing protein [Haemonchus contortus]